MAPCFWTNSEVLQWMKNSLPELFNKYGGFFKSHGIRGMENDIIFFFNTLKLSNSTKGGNKILWGEADLASSDPS